MAAGRDPTVMDRMNATFDQRTMLDQNWGDPQQEERWAFKPGSTGGGSRGGSPSRRGSTGTGSKGGVDTTLYPWTSPSQATPSSGGIQMTRVEAEDNGELMGMARRNPLTGEVAVRLPDDFPDFAIVDLWTRDFVVGGVESCQADIYLFRPVPLNYRTWIYHDIFNCREIRRNTRHGDTGSTVKHVLEYRSIDAPIVAGRWSPMVCYAPLTLGLCLVQRPLLVLTAVLVLTIIYAITVLANNRDTYRLSRLICFPIKVCTFVAIALLWPDNPSFLAYIGLGIAVICGAIDIALGDISEVMNYKFACSYDVVNILGERVFICRRRGAEHLEENFGSRGTVDELVTGITWNHKFSLIADIHGVLVELRPTKIEDWKRIHAQFRASKVPPTYIGLDIFNAAVPDIDAYVQSKTLFEKTTTSFEDVVVSNV